MSWWKAKYKNSQGEYEITFASKDYEKAKTVELVCQAIIDKKIKEPGDLPRFIRDRKIGQNSNKLQQEIQQGEPLTLDELRDMRGRWVWVVSPDVHMTVSAWAYVGENHVFTYWEYEPDALVGRVVYPIEDYGAWLAYRNKPEDGGNG